MINVSNKFKDIIFKSSYLQWEFEIIIYNQFNKETYKFNNKEIKSINISGDLQKEFTIGSSLSLSLNIELLVSEKTPISENSKIEIKATLLNNGLNESVKLGTYYVTEVDRTSIGKLIINASDIMGHANYLSDYINLNNLNLDFGNEEDDKIVAFEACDIVISIARIFNLEIENNIPLGNKLVTYIDINWTYRQLLEYLAMIYGGFVKITRDNKLTFFYFKDSGITLTKDNYYTMTKGQYNLNLKKLICVKDNDNTLTRGEGKINETVSIINPFVTEGKMDDIFNKINGVNYYPISTSLIGNCILEPGDIVKIEDHYGDIYDLYIQSYKLMCTNGIKESFESFYDYNKSSISNSVSNRLDMVTKSFNTSINKVTDEMTNMITKTDFNTTINDLNKNIEISNNGISKWLVQLYSLDYDDNEYTINNILGRTPNNIILIQDSTDLVVQGLYDNTLIRYFTAVFSTKNVVTEIKLNSSLNNVLYYFNSNLIQNNKIEFKEGWNTVEIYTGIKDMDSINVNFLVSIPNSTSNEFTFMTSPDMNKYKDEELMINPNYISIMNPYAISLEYTRYSEIGRLITTESIKDRISDTYVTNDTYSNKISQVEQTLGSINQSISETNKTISDNDEKYEQKFSEIKQTTDNITSRVESTEKTISDNDEKYEQKFSEIKQTTDGLSLNITSVSNTVTDMGTEYEKKFADITASVEEAEFKFSKSSGNNFFVNSGFFTDSFSSNYIFETTKSKDFNYLTSEDYTEDSNLKNFISTKNLTLTNEPSNTITKLYSTDSNINKNSDYGTISAKGFFTLKQTVSDPELIPKLINRRYQLFMSVNAKSIIEGFNNVFINFFLEVKTSNSSKINYYYFNSKDIKINSITNIIGSRPLSYDEPFGKSMFRYEYSTSTSTTVTSTSYILPSKASKEYNNYNPLSDSWENYYAFIDLTGLYDIPEKEIEEVSFGMSIYTYEEISDSDNYSITTFLNEPLLCTTKDFIRQDYSPNPNEIFSGSTKINYDGIEVSKNTSPIKTKIRNTGMSIYNNDNQLAYFESNAYVPVLESDIIISNSVASKSYSYSSTKQVITVGSGYMFPSLKSAFNSLPDFISCDYLVIEIYGNNIISFDTCLKNKKCGVIEILMQPESNIQGYPLLISNIEGIVRIRSNLTKTEITMDDNTIENSFGNIGYCLFCNNIRQLEINSINFSRENLSSPTVSLNNFSFPFNYIYRYSGIDNSATELVDILKWGAIFIGNCNLVDINRCNFGAIGTGTTSYGDKYTYKFKYGIVGDHSDCYLFNNRGSLNHYYINRDKCWFRLPVKSNVSDSEWNQIYKPDSSVSDSGIGNIIDGNNGNSIEQSTGSNSSGNIPSISEEDSGYVPPYTPTTGSNKIIFDTIYGAYSSSSDSAYRNILLPSYSETSKFNNNNLYVGYLAYENSNNISNYYRIKDNDYGKTKYDTYHDIFSYSNKYCGIEFKLNNYGIKNLLSGAYSVNSINLNLKFSNISYASSNSLNSKLYFYVRLLCREEPYSDFEGEDYYSLTQEDALHYTSFSILLDSTGIVEYTYNFSNDGFNGLHGGICEDYTGSDVTKYFHSPFTANINSSSTLSYNIRLDNKTFKSSWISDIENKYNTNLNNPNLNFEPRNVFNPNIFTNIKKMFQEGYIVGIQILPTRTTGVYGNGTIYKKALSAPESDQCLKITDAYLDFNITK